MGASAMIRIIRRGRGEAELAGKGRTCESRPPAISDRREGLQKHHHVLRRVMEKLCPTSGLLFEAMPAMAEEISIDPPKKDTGFL